MRLEGYQWGEAEVARWLTTYPSDAPNCPIMSRDSLTPMKAARRERVLPSQCFSELVRLPFNIEYLDSLI
jgi:hypothetical protein